MSAEIKKLAEFLVNVELQREPHTESPADAYESAITNRLKGFHEHVLVQLTQVGNLASIAMIAVTDEGRYMIEDIGKMLKATAPAERHETYKTVKQND